MCNRNANINIIIVVYLYPIIVSILSIPNFLSFNAAVAANANTASISSSSRIITNRNHIKTSTTSIPQLSSQCRRSNRHNRRSNRIVHIVVVIGKPKQKQKQKQKQQQHQIQENKPYKKSSGSHRQRDHRRPGCDANILASSSLPSRIACLMDRWLSTVAVAVGTSAIVQLLCVS